MSDIIYMELGSEQLDEVIKIMKKMVGQLTYQLTKLKN